MLCILPEVVNDAVVKGRKRQLIGRVQHLQRLRIQGCEVAVLLQYRRSARIFSLDPGQLFVAVDIFQPGVLVRLLRDWLLGYGFGRTDPGDG